MVPHTEKDQSLKALFQSSSTDLEMPVYSKIDERISIAAFSCPKIINYCFVLCEKNDLKSFRKCNIAWHTFATDKLFWVDIVLVTRGNLSYWFGTRMQSSDSSASQKQKFLRTERGIFMQFFLLHGHECSIEQHWNCHYFAWLSVFFRQAQMSMILI